jgi:TolB-like protein
MGLFNELKRRNVFRVGIAYLLGAWVLLQGADFGLQVIDAPNWILQVLVLVAAIALPAVLVFAWVFEMTSEGLKRESEINRADSITTHASRKLDRVIIGVLVAAVALLVIDRMRPDTTAPATATQDRASSPVASDGAPAAADNEKISIAVLPFVNMSSDPEQEYFSDGITEEILNRLAKIEGLQVAARTSVFSFKGQNQDIREVAALLGVSTMLEGSVRRDGEQVRITAQLIRASDGFHLWSETYDRKIESIFAVQDEISQHIAEALQVSLGIWKDAAGASTATTNPEVYDLFLRGRALHRQRGSKNLLDALDLFERALVIDPDFAPAWAGLSHSLNVITAYASLEEIEALGDVDERSLRAAEKALELDPKLATALHAMANNLLARYNWAEAHGYYEKALAQDPESTDIMEDYGHFLLYSWQTEKARLVADQMIKLDPFVPVFRFMALRVYATLGETEVHDSHMAAAQEINPLLFNIEFRSLLRLIEDGDFSAAHSLADQMDFQDWTTPKEMRRVIDWISNPVTRPDDAMLNAIEFRPDLALLAGDYDTWFEVVLRKDREWRWEDFLGTLLILSSTANERQFQALHTDPRAKELITESGLPGYWRQIGWPPQCRPVGADDFECEKT